MKGGGGAKEKGGKKISGTGFHTQVLNNREGPTAL